MSHAHHAHDLDAVLAEERELMNFYAPHYRASLFFNSFYYQQERREFVDWMLRTLRADGRDPRGLAWLDVGAGAGEILERLARSGCGDLTGVDIAERMIDQARKNVPSANFIHGSLERHEWGDARFDVVTASLTLHHMADPSALFRFTERHLAPGGWIFLMEYNRGGWGHDSIWKRPIQLLAAPLRVAVKRKNRAALSRVPVLPARFNHAHDLLRYEDILAAMPERGGYRMVRYTRGVFVPALANALVPESRFDRALHRALGVVDGIAAPFDAGFMQGVGAKRIAGP